MPSTVSVLWFICGLAMSWLCFRILLDQFSAPDDSQAQAHVDGHGEALTDKDHELVQATDETHHQHRLEEETMALDFWDRVLAIGYKTHVIDDISDEEGYIFKSWTVDLCNEFIRRERQAAGLPAFPDHRRPYEWEHWPIAGTLVKLFGDSSFGVIGRVLGPDRFKVTSQDLYEADAELRAERYWGRIFMWPVSREADAETFDGHLNRTVYKGPNNRFRLRSLSCPAVVSREDFRIVEACACSMGNCPYRARMAKIYGVDASMLDEWRKLVT